MMDPLVLARQRAVISGEAIPAPRRAGHIYLVKRPPTPRMKCVCGTCSTCRKREGMRRYRATNPPAPKRGARPGPRMELKRNCEMCRGRISDTNRTGFCRVCQTNHREVYRRRRSVFFVDGGGI